MFPRVYWNLMHSRNWLLAFGIYRRYSVMSADKNSWLSRNCIIKLLIKQSSESDESEISFFIARRLLLSGSLDKRCCFSWLLHLKSKYENICNKVWWTIRNSREINMENLHFMLGFTYKMLATHLMNNGRWFIFNEVVDQLSLTLGRSIITLQSSKKNHNVVFTLNVLIMKSSYNNRYIYLIKSRVWKELGI